MEIAPLQLAQFMQLFTGNASAYGRHIYKFSEEDGKEKGENYTVEQRVTQDQYKNHLEGKEGLGIIPIDYQNRVNFAVIDIDCYSDMGMYIRAIEKNNFPIVPFKSKSGGLHLYTFFKTEISAKTAIGIMAEFASILGIDVLIKNKLNKMVEIFPKQIKLEEGKIGSWINLPYYNYEATRQYAIRDNKPLTLDEALVYAQERKTSIEACKEFSKSLSFSDGPPCIQTMDILNNIEVGRNNYLFSVAVYFKKKDENFWEHALFNKNDTLTKPLEKKEIEDTIVASLRKKDYIYKCNEQPCADYCRKLICSKRNYGIGKEGGFFSEVEFGKLYQIKTSEPYYELEVKKIGDKDFKKLRFKSETDLIGQDAFLKLCFRELYTLPIKINLKEWFKSINTVLAGIQIINVATEDDTSVMSIFKSQFMFFMLNRAMAQSKDQIVERRVYFDEKFTRNYYFRMQDFIDWLIIDRRFNGFAPTEIHGIMRDFDVKPDRIRTESGKQLRLSRIHETALQKVLDYKIEPFKAEFVEEKEKF